MNSIGKPLSVVQPCQSTSLKIDITIVDGERRTSCKVSGKPGETVLAFKQRIENDVGIPCEQQALLVREHFAQNDKLLENYIFNCAPVTAITVARYSQDHQNQ